MKTRVESSQSQRTKNAQLKCDRPVENLTIWFSFAFDQTKGGLSNFNATL